MCVIQEYRALQKEITRIEKQIDDLEALAQSPRVSNLSGMPRSGRVSDGMEIVAKIADLRDQYYLKLGRLLDLRADAEKELEKMGREERVIVGYKYIDGLKREEIARRVAYSESTVKRRIKNAMERVEK